MLIIQKGTGFVPPEFVDLEFPRHGISPLPGMVEDGGGGGTKGGSPETGDDTDRDGLRCADRPNRIPLTLSVPVWDSHAAPPTCIPAPSVRTLLYNIGKFMTFDYFQDFVLMLFPGLLLVGLVARIVSFLKGVTAGPYQGH